MYKSKRALPREQHTSTSLRSSANEALLHVLGICRIWYKSRRGGICTNLGRMCGHIRASIHSKIHVRKMRIPCQNCLLSANDISHNVDLVAHFECQVTACCLVLSRSHLEPWVRCEMLLSKRL